MPRNARWGQPPAGQWWLRNRHSLTPRKAKPPPGPPAHLPIQKPPTAVPTVAEILGRWPSLAALARDLGRPYETTVAWVRRARIPQHRWEELEAAATRRGIDVTYDLLRRIDRARRATSTAACSDFRQPDNTGLQRTVSKPGTDPERRP
jgi:hypothetical protein